MIRKSYFIPDIKKHILLVHQYIYRSTQNLIYFNEQHMWPPKLDIQSSNYFLYSI